MAMQFICKQSTNGSTLTNKDTLGYLQRLGWRRFLPITADMLFGLCNRLTFEINSLSYLHVVAMPWLRWSFYFLVMFAGSLAVNLVDISSKVCGVTQGWFKSLSNNQLIAFAKVEEGELKCATA